MIARQPSISSWTSEHYMPPPSTVNGQPDITISVNFHHEKKWVIVTYLYGKVIAYDYSSNVVVWNVEMKGICGQSALSPMSRVLVSTTVFNGIQWLDLNTRKLTSTDLAPSSKMLPVLFVLANIIVVGSATGDVAILQTGKQDPVQVLTHHNQMVQALVYFHNYR
ncbi:hypothetical protein K438DRAFT_1069319 [Mycena galopus ATCC 62051]|nr:hypothetical protein K438DRAFT_1069319 [Mycena galopus ATCC 62051]